MMFTTNKKARKFAAKIALAATIFAFAPQGAEAQTMHASQSHYSTDDGLCSNAVSNIIQDDYGYIWIGTWNGLSRFDGFNFFNYKTGGQSKVPLLHNRITELINDQWQNIWMRMYDGRVFMLERSKDRIVNPLANIKGHENIKTQNTMAITSKGEVLAIMKDVGIYKMKYTKWGFENELITTGQLKPTVVVEGYKGDLWVGTDKGVRRLSANHETLSQNALLPDESVTAMYSNGYNVYVGTKTGKIYECAYGQEPQFIKDAGKAINSIFRDSYGTIWISTGGQGITRINEKTGDMKEFTQLVLVPEYDVTGVKVSEVAGTVWLTMSHGGFGYYNRSTDEVEYFHNNPANTWDLSNTVAAYLALPEGVVFESTSRKGLEKLEIQKRTIERRKLFDDSAIENNENETRAMYYDAHYNVVLIGNKKGSLIITDGTNKTVVRGEDKGMPFGRIYGITKDRRGDYWISTKGNGLFRLSPRAKEGGYGALCAGGFDFTNFRNNPDNKYSISSDLVYKTIEDKYGNLWVATYGGGVNVIKREKDGRCLFLNRNNVMKSYPNDAFLKVRTVTLDKYGRVWAGSSDGILVMSYFNNKVKIQVVGDNDDEEDNLQSRDVVCLACAHNGQMWVGTNGGGLSRCDDYGQGVYVFDTFGSQDGLPSEEIKSITFDERGNVWFATDHILCSFDVRKQIFSTFTMLDGVDDTLCSEDAALTMPNGKILFGTLNGYYIVDRSKLVSANGSVMRLRITDFMIYGVIQSPRFSEQYDYYIPDARKVELPANDDEFSIRFASLNYQLQHRIHYQYMLEGYEEDWHNADKTRTATYSGLPAGTYEFKVRAFLLESPDKYDLKTITVVVPQHFLLSENAVWIYMVLAAAVAITLLYIKQERRRKEEREYEEELKGSVEGTDNESSAEAEAAPKAEEEVIEEAEIIED
ncbi:MAG: two-component regulator propeller domain-containing protein [Prevotella sp.]